jgi:hypothetical protein
MKELVEASSLLTRGELLTGTWSVWEPKLQQERQDDLKDVATANASRSRA